MLVELAGFDLTNLIDHPSLAGSKSTSDPLESMTFEFVDIGSQLYPTFGQHITVWDDTTPSTVVQVPTRNYLVNQLIAGSSPTTPYGPWVTGGALSSVLSFQIVAPVYAMSATFANNTYSGGNNTAYITQNVGYSFFAAIVPGQTYMASVTIQGSGTISNIKAFLTIQYLDGTQTPIGSPFTTEVVPTLSSFKFSTSGVAPAGAVYAQMLVGGKATVSGTNSGVIQFIHSGSGILGCVTLEPVLFPNGHLEDGTPILYPTPDCTTTSIDAAILPDGTTTRMRWIFNGYIKDIKVTYEGTNRTYVLDCMPMGDVIDNGAIINAAYESTTDQAIINNLVSTYFSTTLSTGQPNFNLPPATVNLGQNISNVSYSDSSLRDVLNSLADSTGFIYYVDEYNYLHYSDTPFDYSLIQVNVDSPDYVTSYPPQNYQVEYDGSQLRNSVKVLGGQYYTSSTDAFNGNGSTKSFTLTSPPQNFQNVTIGGTLYAPTSSNKVGIVGQDKLGVNGVVVLYDHNSSVVTFNTAPASGTNNVLVTYTTYRNVAVQIEDNNSIGQYQRHFYSKVTDTTIADSPTAQMRGVSEVGAFAQPLIILTFDLNVYIARGLAVLVTSALDNFAAQAFIVQQVDTKSMGGGVVVYSYTAGQYRPSMTDSSRNTYKALQGTGSGSGSTVVQLTVESMVDSTYYGDSVSGVLSAVVTATYGGAGVYYGFASFD